MEFSREMFRRFRFVHVTENNISIVLFDAHGSVGQDESYLKSHSHDWLNEQYDDYIKLAK